MTEKELKKHQLIRKDIAESKAEIFWLIKSIGFISIISLVLTLVLSIFR